MNGGKFNILQAGIGVLLGLILGVGGMTLSNRTRPAPIVIQPPAPTATPGPTATPAPISIYINGEVANPGVYEVSADSRVEQAIAEAGGLTDDAFEDGINLAAVLFDGAQIYIAAKDQVEVSSPTLLSNTVQGSADSGGDAAGQLVNINSATKEQLEEIPGVGPSTAQKILDYREDNGTFKIIEDIMNVSGIGEGKFDGMRDFITVDGG